MDGSIEVKFNMGSGEVHLAAFPSHLSRKFRSATGPDSDVADGRYHVVRFVRVGPNGTVQVDDRPPLRRRFEPRSGPSPRAITGLEAGIWFNDQSEVIVGATRRRPRLAAPLPAFRGLIAGVQQTCILT